MASIYTQYILPPASVSDVCASQTAPTGTNLALNGNLVGAYGQVNFINNGYCRNLSLTSANNLSSVSVTISGVQNGAQVGETLAGPNANTVYSNKCYDIVFSVNVNALASGLSVGTGTTAFFKFLPIDLTRNPTSYALSISSLLTSSTQYSTQIWNTSVKISDSSYTVAYQDIVTNNIGTLNVIKTYSGNGNLYILPASSAVLTYGLLVSASAPTSSANNGLTLTYIQV